MASRPDRHSGTVASPVILLAIAIWVQVAGAVTSAWEPLGPEQTVNLVVADPRDARLLYAGTATGVFRSRDSGQTWERPAGSMLVQNVLSLVVDATWEDRLYAGTSLGLYSTANGGDSWEQVESVGDGILALATGPVGSGLIYAGTFGRGVFSHADGDSAWRQSDTTLTNGVIFDLAASPLDTQTVYAGTADGLFASSDRGTTWRRLGAELTGESVRSIYLPPLPDGDLIVLGTFGRGVVRSTDGGANWVSLNQGLDPPQVRDLAVVDDTFAGIMFAATSTGGFYRTRDGGQRWQPINEGVSGLITRSVLIDPAAADRILGTGPDQGVWEMRFAPEPQISVIPRTLAFGSVPVGLQQTRSLEIANVGTADLIVADVSVRGSAGFSVVLGEPLVIPPGGRRHVVVAFSPPLRDLFLGDELIVSSNDLDEPALRVTVTGMGTRAILNVIPATLDFGRVGIRAGVADTTMILRNTGSTPLTLLSASFDEPVFRVVAPWPKVLQAGESATLPVSFAPTAPVSHLGRLRIICDSIPDTLEVLVTGTGTAPDIGVSATVLEFGQVDLGSERTLPLTVTNTGTGDLTVSALRTSGSQFGAARPTIVRVGVDTTLIIAGSDSTMLTASEDSTLIAPGAAYTFGVTFRPEASGRQVDTLTIASDAFSGSGLTQVILRGEGNALSLRPADHIPIGRYPVDLVVADLDGDFVRDLAIVDSLTGELHILLNDGTGSYPADSRTSYPQTPVEYSRWVEPVTIAAARLHGPGQKDLIIGDRVAQSLSVLKNDGQGGFGGAREDIYIGHALTDVETADLNGDVDEDIIVANGPGTQSISVLFGNGRGGIRTRAAVSVQSDPVALAAGHLNPDGYVDLVVANRASNTVSVLLNDRHGGFPEHRHESVGVSPEAVALADYDADGDGDILVANSGTQTVVCLRNNGNGEFTPGPILSTGLRPHSLVVAGLTADIYNDILIAGQGDFLVFLENSYGAQFERQDLSSGSPIRAVRIADLDGNRVNDIIGLSTEPAGVQIYLGLAERQIPPRPPAHVEAVDVARDQGGAIRVTWMDGDYGTRPLEEQIIQTTRYVIVRSDTPDFRDPDTLGTVPGGSLSFVDHTATPFSALYYQVTAHRGSLTSAPSIPDMAVSLPAPLVDLRPLKGPSLSVGDTLKIQVFLTPAQHEIAGISLFMTYDPNALQIIPDSSRSDTARPIRVHLTGMAEPVNAVHDTAAPGKLDLSLIARLDSATGLIPGRDAVLVGEVWFAASKDTSTYMTIDDDPLRNRTTAVVENVNGKWILPALADTVHLSVKDHRVGGQVELENRDSSSAPVQATLLFLGDAGDTLVSFLNDEDIYESGIQTTLDGDGGFDLAQIPPGTYRVFAKAPTHLQGSLQADTITIDTSRSNLRFKWVAGVASAVETRADSAVLPAGDADDDNRINLADFGLLVRYFGALSTGPNWPEERAADFDGSGRVGYGDFHCLADNFGRVGMEPGAAVYKLPSRGGRWAATQGQELAIAATGLGPVSGFSLLVEGATPVTEVEGTMWDGLDLQVHDWPEGRGRRVCGALRDPGQSPPGEGVFLHLTATGVPSPRVLDVQFLDSDGRVFRVSDGSRPVRASLGQNYPNPFNPHTTIPFAVPSLGGQAMTPVRLVVYNVAGQRIRVLVDEPRLPGAHRVIWDGRDSRGSAVATGAYFYGLEIGRFRQTRRLLLLR